MELRVPDQSERFELISLLTDNGLPVEDLETSVVEFIVALEDNTLVGVVGLQSLDGIGLLRSLAVRNQARGGGMGGALVDAVEARASAAGITQLVLLTQTAAPFFARHGYAVIARDRAPAEVQLSEEFRSICPASATCMTKYLGARP